MTTLILILSLAPSQQLTNARLEVTVLSTGITGTPWLDNLNGRYVQVGNQLRCIPTRFVFTNVTTAGNAVNLAAPFNVNGFTYNVRLTYNPNAKTWRLRLDNGQKPPQVAWGAIGKARRITIGGTGGGGSTGEGPFGFILKVK